MTFDEKGLAPAVVQHARTGEVLMLAFVNAEALRLTLETGEAHFFSRSRGALWRKGETSGNVLRVVEVRLDCDEDAVLVRAEPAGPTCHTGKPSCFFQGGTFPSPLAGQSPTSLPRLPDGSEAAGAPDGADAAILERVFAVIEARKADPARRSYVRTLLDGGAGAIGAKLCEEAGELSRAIAAESDERVVAEAADVLFHLLVALGARDVAPSRVFAELSRRFGVSGLDEKASRGSAK